MGFVTEWSHASYFLVGVFNVTGRSSQVCFSLIDFEQRRDLVIIGTGKRVLRGHDFDIVGSASLEFGRGLESPLAQQDLIHHSQS